MLTAGLWWQCTCLAVMARDRVMVGRVVALDGMQGAGMLG